MVSKAWNQLFSSEKYLRRLAELKRNEEDFHHQVSQGLHSAAEDGLLDVVVYLLHRGADVEETDSLGWRALLFAAHNCHTDVAQVLLDHGAEVDSTDVNGNTALHQASGAWSWMEGGTDVVKLLLERGADPNRANNDGDTPLHKTFFNIEDGGKHTDKVQLLVDGGADPHTANLQGETPLAIAQARGYLDIVNLLSRV